MDEEKLLLRRGEGPLDDEPEIVIELGQAGAEDGEMRAIEDGDLGGFDGLDIEPRRLLPVEALEVGEPPVFDRKLGNLFDPVFPDEIHAKTTFEDEIIGVADLPFLQQELFFL